ncbi:hypothetical protein U9R90_18555 [Streptomyces sp. E11-3]|uniref:hypothetical protein n=1 Tax=Streptomyces sp. E11-3 TaxID=3110112 RepID=UPI00397F45CD
MSHPCPRRRAAVNALLSVVFVALTLGVFCGAASAAPAVRAGSGVTAGSAATADIGDTAAERAAVDAARAASTDDGQGCGQRDPSDPDGNPATPPRGAAASELLTALAHGHGGYDGAWLADTTHGDALADRAPPLDPPTPVELSVLRV